VTGLDWQDADPTVFDPDNPLALLEKAAAAEAHRRALETVRALKSMVAAEADAGVMLAARDYVKRHKLATLGDFDRLVRQERGQHDDGEQQGPTQAEILAGYAQERYTLHRDGDDQPYALPKDGPPIARYLRGGRSLRAELAAIYLRERGRPPSSSALADALGAVEGLALTAEVLDTHIRSARAAGTVYLDLGRDDGAVVKISAGGWEIVTESPVVWHRTSHTGPLPDPERGGSLGDLWQLARAPEEVRPLAAAWIVCALLGLVTPILDINGEHGSGKTSAAVVIGNVVDTVKPGGPPGNSTDLVVAAARRMIVLIDNLEDLPPWLTATLCRLVTGEELSRRALYTDSDEVVLSLRRPVITTSIDVGAVPADYADRLVRLPFPVLSEDTSLSEEEWAAAWARARPQAMGALLDLAVRVLAELPGIRLERTPRMGDYARVLAAADQVLGTDGLATYRAQRGKAEADSVESDPATSALLVFLGETWPAKGPASWEGSMSDLLDDITPKDKPQDWPKTPRALQAKLAKFAKPLRRVGVAVSSTGEKQPGTRRTLWQIERVAAQSFNPSDPSGTASDLHERPEGSGEGSHPGRGDPSAILPGDTPSDLRESAAKDVKDSEAISLAEPGEQTGVMCADPGCGFPLDAVWLELAVRVHPGCHDPQEAHP
jgi:hypothetical protein